MARLLYSPLFFFELCIVLVRSVRLPLVPQLWFTEEIGLWQGGSAAACLCLYVLIIVAPIHGVCAQEQRSSFHLDLDSTIVTEWVVRVCALLETMETMG